MKKILIFGLIYSCSILVFAKPAAQYNANPHFKEVPWSEQERALPPFPDLTEEEWQNFYVSENYKNTALLHVGSLNFEPKDKTIRYVLNIKSPSGVDNLSAEAIRCGERSFKIFAYGDSINHLWIENRRANWGAISLDDETRSQLYSIFCQDGSPKNREELVKKVLDGSAKGGLQRPASNSAGSKW